MGVLRDIVTAWSEIRRGLRPQPEYRDIFVTVKLELDGEQIAEQTRRVLLRDARRNRMYPYGDPTAVQS